MKNLLVSITAFSLLTLFLVGCGDQDGDEGNLNFNFKVTYQGDPLVIGNRYQFDNQDILFERVSFFISDFALKNESGSTHLKDVDYINLTESHKTLSGANGGFDYIVRDIPSGEYQGITYNLGVDEATNLTIPSDYSSSSALSNDAEHWPDWSSYVFIKIQGRMDTNGDGELNQNIVMHLGSDAAFRMVDLTKNISVVAGQSNTVLLTLDLYKVFDDGTNKYDFSAVPITHSLNFIDQINAVATGVQQAFKVN